MVTGFETVKLSYKIDMTKSLLHWFQRIEATFCLLTKIPSLDLFIVGHFIMPQHRAAYRSQHRPGHPRPIAMGFVKHEDPEGRLDDMDQFMTRRS